MVSIAIHFSWKNNSHIDCISDVRYISSWRAGDDYKVLRSSGWIVYIIGDVAEGTFVVEDLVDYYVLHKLHLVKLIMLCCCHYVFLLVKLWMRPIYITWTSCEKLLHVYVVNAWKYMLVQNIYMSLMCVNCGFSYKWKEHVYLDDTRSRGLVDNRSLRNNLMLLL